MPVHTLWRSRSPLYKLALVILLVTLPVNLISLILPFWLHIDGNIGDTEELRQKFRLHYGMWELCFDGGTCFGVHEVRSDIGIGDWLYWVKVLALFSVMFHGLSALCGCLQNFLSRNISRHWTCYWKKALHRDCTYTEDIGFIAGVLGQVASIVFMLNTKDRVSAGASYSSGFALGFLATSLTVLSTLTLTKAHAFAEPRLRRSRRARHSQAEPAPQASEQDTIIQAEQHRSVIGEAGETTHVAGAEGEVEDPSGFRQPARTADEGEQTHYLGERRGATYGGRREYSPYGTEQRRSLYWRSHANPAFFSEQENPVSSRQRVYTDSWKEDVMTTDPDRQRALEVNAVHLEDKQQMEFMESGTALQGRSDSRSSLRRYVSRSRSRSKERSSGSKSRQQKQHRLMRSEEMEDIPAALSPEQTVSSRQPMSQLLNGTEAADAAGKCRPRRPESSRDASRKTPHHRISQRKHANTLLLVRDCDVFVKRNNSTTPSSQFTDSMSHSAGTI